MLSIQEKIVLYAELPESERAEVEQYILENPELETLFEESKALHALLDSAQRETEIEPALQRLTATAEDPIARFERLTAKSAVHAPDREAIARQQGMRLLRPVRLALAACVAFVAIYGALAILSWQLQSDRAQQVGLHNTGEAFEEMTFRGTADPSIADDLDEALELLDQARSSTLGLFPTYDGEQLDTAAEIAERIATNVAQSTMKRTRANYILGKIRMYQGHDEEAAQALQVVVDNQGEGAEDARRLIDLLNSQ